MEFWMNAGELRPRFHFVNQKCLPITVLEVWNDRHNLPFTGVVINLRSPMIYKFSKRENHWLWVGLIQLLRKLYIDRFSQEKLPISYVKHDCIANPLWHVLRLDQMKTATEFYSLKQWSMTDRFKACTEKVGRSERGTHGDNADFLIRSC